MINHDVRKYHFCGTQQHSDNKTPLLKESQHSFRVDHYRMYPAFRVYMKSIPKRLRESTKMKLFSKLHLLVLSLAEQVGVK